jgi:hypothetical protein
MASCKHVRVTHDTLGRIGAEAFADRARHELLATGTARKRIDEMRNVYTPQQAQVALLARDGLFNPTSARTAVSSVLEPSSSTCARP